MEAEAKHRLLWREMPERSKDVPFPELALIRAGSAHAGRAANTLLIYADEIWSAETARVLTQALEGCGRYDAGLGLLVLFKDGRLGAPYQHLQEQVQEFARYIGISAFVNEDVGGAWSKAFKVRSGAGAPAWRLIAPDGVVTWSHDGQMSQDVLINALDVHLRRSPDPTPSAIRPRLEVGQLVTGGALSPGFLDEVESHCPPIPLRRRGVTNSVVVFVQSGSVSSTAQLRNLSGRYGQQDKQGAVLVVVVDGADARETEALMNKSGVDVVVISDPTGAITDRFGVGIWPTTMTIDHVGRISAIEMGISPIRQDADDDTAV